MIWLISFIALVLIALLLFFTSKKPIHRITGGSAPLDSIDLELSLAFATRIPDLPKLLVPAPVIRTVAEIPHGMFVENTTRMVNISAKIPVVAEFLAGMLFFSKYPKTRICYVTGKHNPVIYKYWAKYYPRMQFTTMLPRAPHIALCFGRRQKSNYPICYFDTTCVDTTSAYLPAFGEYNVQIIYDSANPIPLPEEQRATSLQRLFYYHNAYRQYATAFTNFGECFCQDCSLAAAIANDHNIAVADFYTILCQLANVSSLSELHITNRAFANVEEVYDTIHRFVAIMPPFTFTYSDIRPWRPTPADATHFAQLASLLETLYGEKAAKSIARILMAATVFAMDSDILRKLLSLKTITHYATIDIESIIEYFSRQPSVPLL